MSSLPKPFKYTLTFSFAFLCLVFTGCKDYKLVEMQPCSSPSWAVVNHRTIIEKFNGLILEKYPYPEKFSENIEALQSQRRNLDNQISNLKRQNNIKCLKDEVRASGNINIAIPRYARSDQYDQKCLENLPEDILVKDLELKLNDVKEIIRGKNKHRDMLYKHVRENVSSYISPYIQGEYDLIIDRNSKILHSETGVVLDITDAVLRDIAASPPVFTLDLIE